MKKLALLIALVIGFAGSAHDVYGQTLAGPSGASFPIVDARIGAGDSLHYVGTIDLTKDFGAPVDSIYAQVVTNDSANYTLYIAPGTFIAGVALTSDTVAWNATADAYPYMTAHVGAQDTSYAWHNLVARGGPDKIKGASQLKVYVLIRASGSAMASRNRRGWVILRPYR